MNVPPDRRPIFLTGFMGSGKTTTGALLASRLGWEFIDTDARVCAREGRDVERIFRESGEDHFRQAEWEELRALDGLSRCVVATGGGLFQGARQRSWMRRRGPTVWLDVALETLRQRLGPGAGRPLWLAGEPIELRALFERRRALYALAEIRVDASAGAPAEIAQRILRRIPTDFG